ncbi:hypothetical protein GALL_520330 [mine drainage metagenome]|uniref:Uncharacterized protein n=1 Tax=mine drainage metagenome TaxID=410659 RepID=A0A1J5PFS7_9ZZZZ
MLGSAVYEQRFQGQKKIARRAAPTLLGLPIGAKFGAQFLHDGRGARDFGAAKLQPLELGQQVAASRRRQSLQKVQESVGLFHLTGFATNGKLMIRPLPEGTVRLRNQ